MNTYSSYKDSGVEWIGEVPGEWNVKRLDHFFTERKDKVDDVSYPPLSVTMKGIKDQLEGVAKSDDSSNRKLVLKSDFVINSRSDRKGSSGISFRDGSVSLINTVLEPKNIEPNYVNYLFKSYYFIEEYFRFGKGIHFDLWSTNYSVMKNIKIPVLSIEEQQQISDYLDYKTSKIDTLIEKTQQKIELLKEQRISLINTTVTKGLDPNVEMKDSGVEWIGDIPSDWKVKKLTYVTNSIGSGTTPKTSNSLFYEEGHIPWLNTGDLNDGYIYKTKKKVTKLAIEKHTSLKVFPINSVSIAMYGATIGKLGLFKIPVTVNQANCVFVFDEVNVSKFWFYVLMEYRPQIVSLGYGGGQPNISQDLLKSLRFGCPSYKNQQQIVDYLDKETLRIDKLVDIESKRIDLLKEYRQSLISEVVTGKVDVRDEVLV